MSTGTSTDLSTDTTGTGGTRTGGSDPSLVVLPDDAPPTLARKREGLLAILLPPLVLGLMTIGVWYFVSYVLLDAKRRFLLQPPHLVFKNGFADTAVLRELGSGLWSSSQVALWGLSIAIIIGFSLAVIMSQSKLIERAVFPYQVMLQATPILATPFFTAFNEWHRAQASRTRR